ncbi:MAG: sigma-70 family RNA polymerase sigma factor [Dethiosulfatibacter sp.]|nr:sigma-70 family RNA polymerase sigma factor [Dethiosulfatibacter sp.]
MNKKNSQEVFNRWLDKARKGDVRAMEKVMEMLTPLVTASAKKYFLGDMPYEDLMQEGYLVIAECVDQFDASRGIPFLGYVKTTLRFHFMDMGRKAIKEQCDSLNRSVKSADGNITLMDVIADEEASADGAMLQDEKMKALMLGIKILSPRELQVISLNYYVGLNMIEVARELGIAYRTVVNTKVHALRKLEAYLR